MSTATNPAAASTTPADAEALVRRAYYLAEGATLDADAFAALFTDDGIFRNVVGQESYEGDHLGDLVTFMGTLAPDVHRELHRVTATEDLVTVELTIEGTFAGPFPTPVGILEPTGAKFAIPTADFWHIEGGKIKEFNCYLGVSVMLAQMGIMPDFASAVAGQ
ncbi:MAG: hypothetical protein JWR52_1071 [Marmoricola sp.]|nr:hypothetical protein [Marmoricola sp.]